MPGNDRVSQFVDLNCIVLFGMSQTDHTETT